MVEESYVEVVVFLVGIGAGEGHEENLLAQLGWKGAEFCFWHTWGDLSLLTLHYMMVPYKNLAIVTGWKKVLLIVVGSADEAYSAASSERAGSTLYPCVETIVTYVGDFSRLPADIGELHSLTVTERVPPKPRRVFALYNRAVESCFDTP